MLRATGNPLNTFRLSVLCAFAAAVMALAVGRDARADAEAPAASPAASERATVSIDTAAPSVPYDRKIFGGFIEHFDGQIYGGLFEPGSPLANARGFRKDVIEAVKQLKVSVVRWPGGCFASGYHWRDGVGRNRKPTPDPVWGVVDPNTFGTDEFVEWCRLVGCEPYICTNAGSGTPEEMRDWVEYCNAASGKNAELRAAGGRKEPLNVRYWSIGNENWGGHEIGAKTPAEWGPLVARSAELMRAADPKLTLLAAATPDRGWTLPLLKAAGDRLDYVCIHHYWLGLWGKNAQPDYLSCIQHSDGPERMIVQVIDILKEAGCRGRVKIAFDEWNLRGWHHPGFPRKEVVKADDRAAAALIARRQDNAIASQYSMADALFSASFLNACLRHAEDVGMANIAPLVNTRGPLFVHPNGIVKRTTFHTLAMYANELEARVGKAEVLCGKLAHPARSVAIVDAVATVSESGNAWSVALVNRHPSKAVACTLSMKGRTLDGPHEAIVLAGDSPDAYNDIEHPDRVAPVWTRLAVRQGVVELPPHSLTIVKIKGTAAAAAPAVGTSVKRTVRPNIILCMTDDQGWGDVSYNGLRRIRTPNLDAMASGGLRFDRFYAQHPSCSPTRASVMTGRHPYRMGTTWPGMPLDIREMTIAQAVKRAGYATGHFGKWHLSGGRPGAGRPLEAADPLHPGRFGFDEWFTVSNWFDLDWTFSHRGQFVKTRGDGSDAIVAEALKFIEQSSKEQKPFLAVVWFGSPHVPLKPTPEDLKAAGGSAYYGELVGVDRSMGTLRKRLRELGIADNTMVWFCSDNGAWVDEKAAPDAFGSNGGLRGHKGDLWEGGIRVPGIVEWPAVIKAPAKTDVAACTSDLYPTVVDLLQLEIPDQTQPLDGVSLMPLIHGQMKERPRPIGFMHYGEQGLEDGVMAWNDNRYKLVKRMPDKLALFEIASDPWEKNDIAASHPDIVKRMDAELEAWRKSVFLSKSGADYGKKAGKAGEPR